MKILKLFAFILLLKAELFASGIFNITDFGAVAGSADFQTSYIQTAIDSAERSGGGTVLIPAGIFLSSTVFLKDNVILEIAKNGVLRGAAAVSKYPDVIPAVRSYTDHYPQRSLIYAEGKRNIGIKGEGTLDGNGLSFDFLNNSDKKPFGVRFIACTNVLYEGITMKNSGFWMMHNLNCDTLTLRNLKIINHNFGNGDGIDIDGSRHVVVENCTVDSNDDPFVIKTTNTGSAVDIEVRNCSFATYSRAIKIGTETYGPVRNVHIHDCIVKYSTAGPFGTNYAGDCGIQLSIVDGGSMDNVLVENIQISGVQTPIFIRLGDRGEPFESGGPKPGMGSLKNVMIRNITAEAASDMTGSITGIPGFPVRGITLQNIDLTVPGGKGPVPAGFTVPENISSKPAFDMFGTYLPAYGLFIRHADSLTLDNVCISTKRPDQRPEIYWEDSSAVQINPCIATRIQQNLKGKLSIYPNPVEQELILNLEGINSTSEYRITDIMGSLRAQALIPADHSRIDVSALESGIYFITLYNNDEKYASAKFVKR